MSSVVSLAALLFTCVPGVASAKWTRMPPAPVLATYIPRDGQTTTGADGRLVAIELLPDGYTPK